MISSIDYFIWLEKVKEAGLDIKEAAKQATKRWPEDLFFIESGIRLSTMVRIVKILKRKIKEKEKQI